MWVSLYHYSTFGLILATQGLYLMLIRISRHLVVEMEEVLLNLLKKEARRSEGEWVVEGARVSLEEPAVAEGVGGQEEAKYLMSN